MNKGNFLIIGTSIVACDYTYVLKRISDSIRVKKNLLISPISSHTLVRACKDQQLHKVLETFDLLLPDSDWIKKAIHFLYGIRIKKRVYGPELMLKICEMTQQSRLKIFLYGTGKQELIALEAELKRSYPGIQLSTLPSAYRALSKIEEKYLIDKIVEYQPSVIFVGLGSPMQEIFSSQLAQKLQKKLPLIIVSVGAAFDFISKSKPQAPNWIGEAGFEWLFRLVSEPSRLWRRYLVFGPLFLYLVVVQKLKQRSNPLYAHTL